MYGSEALKGPFCKKDSASLVKIKACQNMWCALLFLLLILKHSESSRKDIDLKKLREQYEQVRRSLSNNK